MTGWRVGWVAGPDEIVARLIAIHQYVVTCASSVSQRAALAAFTARGAKDREACCERFHRRRTVMGEELSRIPGIHFTPPDGAFYFFVDVSAHGDSVEIARRLLERRGVVTIPGEAFGSLIRGFLRISFAASEKDIREGIRRIGEELTRSPHLG